MVRPLTNRANLFRKLMTLKCGPGAAKLPAEVTRIHLDYSMNLGNGHMGPRKFFKENLPRLKYHNPSVPMIVNRHTDNSRKPILTVYLRTSPSTPIDQPLTQPTSSRVDLSKAQPPAPFEKTIEIDMQGKHSSHILEYLIAETGATVLLPTAEEKAEIQSLRELEVQSEISRQMVAAKRAEEQKELDMLKRARQAAGMSED